MVPLREVRPGDFVEQESVLGLGPDHSRHRAHVERPVRERGQLRPGWQLGALVGRPPRGVIFQRTTTWKESTDPEYDAKLDRIEHVLDRFPGRAFAFHSSPHHGSVLWQLVTSTVSRGAPGRPRRRTAWRSRG
ncbi:hypothetical protein B6264_26050 [Kitasatospora aureofaciens]|nr:hypothetical protein B6264_26050 [Kitasatospora aureofaciens]